MASAKRGGFPSTHWSVVLAANRSDAAESAAAALAILCETYWYPVYAYIRRRGYGSEAARDLTQGFLTRLLEKGFLPGARPERGRFRSYLLGALKHFLANERDRNLSRRRGGGAPMLRLDFDSGENRYRMEPEDKRTPETVYERRWALAVLETVLDRLESEQDRAGKSGSFERLKPFLTGEGERGGYQRVADELSMTEGALKVAVHRLRRRYRDLLRAVVAQTVETPTQIDAELHHLLAALGD
jgi:DNA-directed RNA polymerase specialized sigma24 family protein